MTVIIMETKPLEVAAPAPKLEVAFADSRAEIIESQKLRYRIFAGELGAQIDGGGAGIDHDEFDSHCRHLVVRDSGSGRIVACTRILTGERAPDAGGFYSESEFDLAMIDALPGRVMEIGRTCVDGDYRGGAAIATLWSGIAEFITRHGYDYLFGCASIGLEDGGASAHAILELIRARHMAPDYQRVRPFIPLPAADVRRSQPEYQTAQAHVPPLAPAPRLDKLGSDIKSLPSSQTPLREGTVSPADTRLTGKPKLPPLLKAYLSLGARACGEAYWDRDFNCADVFMLLNVSDLNPRYARHFLGRTADTTARALPA